MTLFDFPKPNGKTVQEKYEYAKFLVLCKEPTLELLRFLEREKDNFTYRHLMVGGYTFSYDLVWSKGLLFDNLSRQDTTYPHYGVGGYVSNVTSRYYGFSWANPYEASLLEKAVDNLILWSEERTRLAEIQREKDIQNAHRTRVKEWLNTHEES
ncbi:hypothetical protein X824_gp194 [Escherichia phage 4MG]|uniref:Hyphothetical protein n=1 Tax=Escherichia phage 4MG TaxID=1391428 RepID=V5KSE7_9CAUD|nr:hypothetical protein X824_gp194 [Escherichia phage 4MG]AGZ17629.1 hyphothetical protein [Escherichia phage 4MG]